ncbi:cytochrome P450 [Atractiella rhizophila]|nr:cytochrome P450 [Atractiella rhizophila]
MLSPIHLVLLTPPLILLWVLFHTFVYSRWLSVYKNLPGPNFPRKGEDWETDWHPLFGQFGTILRAEAGVKQAEWAKKYGGEKGVVRVVGPFGFERLMFTRPQAYQQIWIDKASSFVRPDFMTGVLRSVVGDGLLTKEGEEHRRFRRVLGPAFAPAHLADLVPEFYPILNNASNILNEKLKESGEAIIDMYDIMSRTTLDIICWTSFGYKCDSLLTHSNELASAYEQLISLQSGSNLSVLILVNFIPLAPRLIPYIGKLGAYLRPSSKDADPHYMAPGLKGRLDQRLRVIGMFSDAMTRIKKVSAEIMDQKRREVKQDAQGGSEGWRKDIMSLLVKSNAGQGIGARGGGLTEDEMMDQILMTLGAGHETTASGMTWTLLLLAQNPRVQSKLRNELAGMLERNMEPDMKELNELQYLDAVVRESLRVRPPVPMTFRKAREDVVIDGTYVKAGTVCYMGIRVINNSPEIWGEDAAEFKPERRLNLPPDHPAQAFQSFIHGPHQCIGNKMALIELKAMVLHLVGKYEYELVSPDQVITPTSAVTMKPKEGLHLRVRKTKLAANLVS